MASKRDSKIMELQKVSDPGTDVETDQENDPNNQPEARPQMLGVVTESTANDAPAGEEKGDGHLSVQISLNSNSWETPRARTTGDLVKKRTMDENGNLTFNRTKSEVERENQIEKKLTQLADAHKSCSFDEWESLIELQCPLPPRSYKYLDENDQKEKSIQTTARLYHGKFWIRHPKTGVIYEALTESKDVKRHQQRLDQMRAVDEYLSAFKLTSSVQIYKRFNKAVGFLEDSKMKKKDKQKEEISYKLIPGWIDRVSFFGTLLRAILNAYFIYYNMSTAFTTENQENLFYFWGILITSSAEAYLFFVAFSRTLYNTKSLLQRLWNNDTVHFQTKNMPMQIREMASTSILRYLPSGETANRLRKRRKENWDEIMEDYRFAVENARKHKITVRIRETLNIGFILFGPILAILALLFKVNSLELAPDQLFGDTISENFVRWFGQMFIPYIGFVNQIAGIRKVRLIEMQALQHFVFSGNDVKLSKHERQMMNVWWNFTVVSCVSNICDKFKYPTFDSIVFWYQLNPRKLQILLKNHDAEGVDFLRTGMKKGKRVIMTTPREDYDKQISTHASKRKLKKETMSQNPEIEQLDDAISDDDDDQQIEVAPTAHHKISEQVEKQKSKDPTPVSDHSDENSNDNNQNQNEDNNENDNNYPQTAAEP